MSADDGSEWDVASDEIDDVHPDTLACWRINYRLDLTPHELCAVWEAGAPVGAVLALRHAVACIERLQVTLQARRGPQDA